MLMFVQNFHLVFARETYQRNAFTLFRNVENCRKMIFKHSIEK